MIKFIEEEDNLLSPPKFCDVLEGQFFIDAYDRLCQKSRNAYVVIASEDGEPICRIVDGGLGPNRTIMDPFIIKKILPLVKKIEF